MCENFGFHKVDDEARKKVRKKERKKTRQTEFPGSQEGEQICIQI